MIFFQLYIYYYARVIVRSLINVQDLYILYTYTIIRIHVTWRYTCYSLTVVTAGTYIVASSRTLLWRYYIIDLPCSLYLYKIHICNSDSRTSSLFRRVMIYIYIIPTLAVCCIMDRESFGTPIVFDARVICVWPFCSAPLKICIRINIKIHIIWPLSRKFSNSSISVITPLNISITTLLCRERQNALQ